MKETVTRTVVLLATLILGAGVHAETTMTIVQEGRPNAVIVISRELFKSRPEYFALVDGVRRGEHPANTCMGDPRVVKLVTENLERILSTQGPWRCYPVGQYDAWLWCECELCKAAYGPKTFVYDTKEKALAVGLGVVAGWRKELAGGGGARL